MEATVYGGLFLAVLAVCAGIWLVVKKKKFALLYAAVAFLLVMILLWWVLPVTRFLQHTPDDQVAYVHQAALEGGDYPAVTDEKKADFLAALRGTGFSHGAKRNYRYDYTKDSYYHVTICTEGGTFLYVDVFVYADGSSEVTVDTGAPWWDFYAADPEPLVKAAVGLF